MNALLALVDSLGALPGRKTVVYFCEGLTVAPAVEAKFRSIIATANRKNVSVYALDAAGLRAHSKQAETARELTRWPPRRCQGVERSDNKKWTEDLEVNEQMLKSDPSAALGILTGQTGGMLIQNTNDLDSGIGRINDDRRNYYALTYSPTNSRPRRHLPQDRGEGEAARRGRARPKRLSGGAGQRGLAGADLRGGRRWRPSRRRHGPPRLPCSTRALSVPMPGRLGLTAILASFTGDAVTFADDPTDQDIRGRCRGPRARDRRRPARRSPSRASSIVLTGAARRPAEGQGGQPGVLPHAGPAARASSP